MYFDLIIATFKKCYKSKNVTILPLCPFKGYMKGVANMQNKKELYSINDCTTLEEVKELNRQRWKRYYSNQENREKKLAYAKAYREKYINKKKNN